MSKKPIKMQVTITFTYEANPDCYLTDNPIKMAKIDQKDFMTGDHGDRYSHLNILMDQSKVKVTVKPL